MRYSLLEFGGMRSFNKVMNNNLTLLENNLIEIKKFLNIGNNDIIDIYILTDKTDINEHSILLCEILKKQNINLKLINYWQELTEYHEKDKESYNKYKNILNIQEYGYDSNNISHKPYGYDGKLHFNPGNLWYRRYVNFNLFKKYVIVHNINYDFVCLTRLFSTKIINLKSLENFIEDALYFSIDTFFMGKFNIIKKLLKFGENSLFVNKRNINTNRPTMLEDKNFINYAKSLDSCIFSHVFCSEIQILYFIYNNFKYKHLRFPFPNYINNKKIFELTYSNNYNKEYLKEHCFQVADSNLFIAIAR